MYSVKSSSTSLAQGQSIGQGSSPQSQPRPHCNRLLDLDLGLPFLGLPLFGNPAANSLGDVPVAERQDDSQTTTIRKTDPGIIEDFRETAVECLADIKLGKVAVPPSPGGFEESSRCQDVYLLTEDQETGLEAYSSGCHKSYEQRGVHRIESFETEQHNNILRGVAFPRPLSIVSNLYSASEKSLESTHIAVGDSAMKENLGQIRIDANESAREKGRERSHIDISNSANTPLPTNDQLISVMEENQDTIPDEEYRHISSSAGPEDVMTFELQATNSDLTSALTIGSARKDFNNTHHLTSMPGQATQNAAEASDSDGVIPIVITPVNTIEGTVYEVLKPAENGSQLRNIREDDPILPLPAGTSSPEVPIVESNKPEPHRTEHGDSPSSIPTMNLRAPPMHQSPKTEQPLLYSAMKHTPIPFSSARETHSPKQPSPITLEVNAVDRHTQRDQDVFSYISSLGIRIGNNIYIDRDNSTSSSADTSTGTGDTQTTNDTPFSSPLTKATSITTTSSASPPMAIVSDTSPGELTSEQKTSSSWQLPIRKGNSRLKTPPRSSKEAVENSLGVIQEAYLPSASPRNQSARRLPHMPSLSQLLSSKYKVAMGKEIADAASNGKAERLVELLAGNPKLINARISATEYNLPKTALMHAAIGGSVRCMDVLRAHGADLLAVDIRDRTALHLAVAANQVEPVRWLLCSYADASLTVIRNSFHDPKEAADLDGSTPLHVAAKRGHGDLVRLLSSKGANLEALDKQGRTPLHIAAMNDQLDVCVYLVAKLAFINAPDAEQMTPLHWAVRQRHLRIVDFLLAKGANLRAFDSVGYLPLHYAVESGQVEAVHRLYHQLEDLETPTKSSETPLHIACSKNCFSVARALLKLGVDANPWTNHSAARSASRSLFSKSSGQVKQSSTPLHYACFAGNYDSAAAMLKFGAWPNAPQEDGKTPLMMAVESENVQLVALLLEHDAKVNAVTPGTCLTALHLSCRKGNLEITKLLVKHGANIFAKTSGTSGLAPLEYAQQGSNKEVSLDKERAVFDYMYDEINKRFIKAMTLSASSNNQPAFPSMPGINRIAWDQITEQQTINLARLRSQNARQQQT